MPRRHQYWVWDEQVQRIIFVPKKSADIIGTMSGESSWTVSYKQWRRQ